MPQLDNTVILENMRQLADRYEQLDRELSDPAIASDPKKLADLARERSGLEPKVAAYERFRTLLARYEEAREVIADDDDPEFTELARSEMEELEGEIATLEDECKVMLLPVDPLDDKDIIMEIRAGTGGDEAALFAGDLHRMYTHFADAQGWKIEHLSEATTPAGGFKEIIFAVSGQDVYAHLKYESGVHRVQRVPATESQGRIHTSAATVAVLPEAKDITIDIDPNDLKIDVYRSSGPGGQSVNTTDSAVRITHGPTGLVVTCQDEKSQLKNKAKALKVLRARLLARAREAQESKRTEARRSMVSTGDRSAKIRTYNFPQNRVTDHRIGLTLHRLEEILSGGMSELIEAVRLADRTAALEAQAHETVTHDG
jgi:peptide chain release factor 1